MVLWYTHTQMAVLDPVFSISLFSLGNKHSGAWSKKPAHLSFFIKSHDDHSSTKLLDPPGLLQEVLLPLLQADAVDDALALAALQAGFNHGEIGRVDAQGHLRSQGQKITGRQVTANSCRKTPKQSPFLLQEDNKQMVVSQR